MNFAHTTLASTAYPAWLGLDAADLRSASILLVFALLFALEALGGHRNTPAKTARQSYLTNLGTFLMNDTLMSLMSVSTLLRRWCINNTIFIRWLNSVFG